MHTISHWCGRFGNNIQQISNAIYFCQKNNLRFSCPENDWINPFVINFGIIAAPPQRYFFFNVSETGQGGPDFNCDLHDLNSSRKEICVKYILPNLKLNTQYSIPLADDICVIHIRSGDIFSRENYLCNVVSKYLQNPFSYYKYISSKYRTCICVYEDDKNPVISELKKINNVVLTRSSFEKDLELLLSTKNLVSSGVSTFSIAAALLSKNLKKLHATDIFLNEHLNPTMLYNKIDVQITKINQDRYIKNGSWLNTKQQRDLMISYEQTYE